METSQNSEALTRRGPMVASLILALIPMGILFPWHSLEGLPPFSAIHAAQAAWARREAPPSPPPVTAIKPEVPYLPGKLYVVPAGYEAWIDTEAIEEFGVLVVDQEMSKIFKATPRMKRIPLQRHPLPGERPQK